MNRHIALMAAPAILLGAWTGAAEQPKLAFEVVSIKPGTQMTLENVQSGKFRMGFNVDGARVDMQGYTPYMMLIAAFKVQPPQLDAPDSTRGQTYDIQAKLPAGATKEQVPEMLQTMLAERFKLAYHRDTREYTVDVLSVGKGGMKLQRLPDDTPPSVKSMPMPDGSVRMIQICRISALIPVLNTFGGMQVVDETGLDGIYTWVQDMTPSPQGTSFQQGQGAQMEALKGMLESAGLRLEKRKVSKETIVVDHMEKTPTEN